MLVRILNIYIFYLPRQRVNSCPRKKKENERKRIKKKKKKERETEKGKTE